MEDIKYIFQYIHENDRDKTFLPRALIETNLNAVKDLCEYNYNENFQKDLIKTDKVSYRFIHILCLNPFFQYEILEYLINENNKSVNTPSTFHNNLPLHIICENKFKIYNRVKIIELILKHTKIKNKKNNFYDRTPLHLACNVEYTESTTDEQFEVIKTLVYNGCSLNAKDSFGNTPLHLAAKTFYTSTDKNKKIIKFLLNNCCYEIKNNFDFTAIDLINSEQLESFSYDILNNEFI